MDWLRAEDMVMPEARSEQAPLPPELARKPGSAAAGGGVGAGAGAEGDNSAESNGGAGKRYVGDDGTRFVWRGGRGGAWEEFTGTDAEWGPDDDDDDDDDEGHGEGEGEEGGGKAGDGKSSGGDGVAKKKKRKKKKGDKWSEKAATSHSWVYVQGLPFDASEDEVAAHFTKCGVLAIDPATQQPRIKLYADPATGLLKGDGSICYAHADSVPLAIQVLAWWGKASPDQRTTRPRHSPFFSLRPNSWPSYYHSPLSFFSQRH
jgi:hypothetical protein